MGSFEIIGYDHRTSFWHHQKKSSSYSWDGMALTYLAYNLKRAVNILGVKEIIKRLEEEKRKRAGIKLKPIGSLFFAQKMLFNLESYFRGKQRVSSYTGCRLSITFCHRYCFSRRIYLYFM